MPTTTKTADITITRVIDEKVQEFKAVANVEVTEEADGSEVYGDVTYEVQGPPNIQLIDAEKDLLDGILGLDVEELTEEDLVEAEEEELDEDDLEEEETEEEEEEKHTKD